MAGEAVKGMFKGCYVATLTPFTRANKVDIGVIKAHTQWLIGNGVDGLSPAGTTGEFLYLTNPERRTIVSATVEAANGRVPVMAGVWALNAKDVADLAHHAESAGAKGVFLPPPIYYPADDKAVFRWYNAVRKATSLPVFAYNIPQYAANAISMGCLKLMFDAGVIAGVKDSTGNTERFTDLVHAFGAKHIVFAASDSFATEGRKIGADGFISAIGNVMPKTLVRLWAGDESLQTGIDALRDKTKQMGSLPALKYLLQRRGFAFGSARLPFSELSTEQRTLLDAVELP
jgi:dihydrodipicolinate synthase/N-acetylneuraminate lyase